LAVHFGFLRTLEDLRCFEIFPEQRRRSYWSVHVQAWRQSGLTRTEYCREHRLTKDTFDRWLTALNERESLQIKAQRKRRRGNSPLCTSKRSIAVQAFWAMHVEAMTWSGLTATHYAAAHRVSAVSLRRWRDILESGEVEVDWRARLHPSARAKISSDVSSAAKDGAAKVVLTDVAKCDPLRDRRSNRRSFTDEEKLAIVLETEQPGVSVAAVCRHHDIATSMVFRWRIQFGFCEKERSKLAAVKLADAQTGASSVAFVLHDLLQPPDGMTAVELADGRRVFAPAGSDPDAVRRHVFEQEAAR
jgi:Transposase